jgi:hypothetical protein
MLGRSEGLFVAVEADDSRTADSSWCGRFGASAAAESGRELARATAGAGVDF